ncbi:MAG: transcription antitermination factor NusB [Carbonactinosporaceae bacterium]
MAARTKARRRALDVLYEADMRGVDPPLVLAESARRSGPPLADYTTTLVEGVAAHLARIDELLSIYSVGWALDRMPVVDRNVLRLGAYELLWMDTVPDAVAISEAVALARDLSTDESPSFVNGLLARLVDVKPIACAGGSG